MPRYHSNTTAIRKYRSEYYRLRKQEARMNHELFRMKNRIKHLAEDEKQSIANHTLLTKLLAHAEQQKAELEAQPVSKQRDKQLKKAERELKDVRVKYKRSDLHLAVIDQKKDKDNAAKYILKEAKRDEVTARIEAAYETWQKFEQLEQQENADFEAYVLQQQAQVTTEVKPLTQEAPYLPKTPLSEVQTSARFIAYVYPAKTQRLVAQHYQTCTYQHHKQEQICDSFVMTPNSGVVIQKGNTLIPNNSFT
ncbi:hypothetical protein QNI16_02440 [Cytophagaceae bacterium YF14B1]|uniref:Uncharacterized protein n=1 Tax=Xanthocytophaga flava TaxID=3048013 RepID=A0AAE3QI80_9BACT|nr:hypothetical protein [Xanthocytophaga flavus]MDJ1479325.1 hypothetical protein [Xanthocytophaga flavus]